MSRTKNLVRYTHTGPTFNSIKANLRNSPYFMEYNDLYPPYAYSVTLFTIMAKRNHETMAYMTYNIISKAIFLYLNLTGISLACGSSKDTLTASRMVNDSLMQAFKTSVKFDMSCISIRFDTANNLFYKAPTFNKSVIDKITGLKIPFAFFRVTSDNFVGKFEWRFFSNDVERKWFTPDRLDKIVNDFDSLIK